MHTIIVQPTCEFRCHTVGKDSTVRAETVANKFQSGRQLFTDVEWGSFHTVLLMNLLWTKSTPTSL